MINRKIKIALLAAAALLLTLFLLRGAIIRLVVDSRIKSVNRELSLDISYKKLSVSGLAGVRIDSLTITPVGKEELMRASKIVVRLNAFKLLFLRPDITKLDISDTRISFIKRDSTSNFEFLYKTIPDSTSAAQNEEQAKATVNYAGLAERLYSLFLDILPSSATIKNFEILYINGDYSLSIKMPESSIKRDTYSATLITDENGFRETLKASGKLDDSERSVSTQIYSDNGSKFSVPFLEFRWGARVQFDTLSFNIAATDSDDGISFSGDGVARGLTIFHSNLSPEDVTLDKGKLSYKINAGINYFELDSSSAVTVNKLTFSPYIRAEKNKKWHFTASVTKERFPAGDLFESFPKGLFGNIEGIKTEGFLSYRFYADIDMNNIDSLRIHSLLKPEKFRIISPGRTDFRRLNSEFEYTAYERGAPVKSFSVGPSNPNFRTLDRISPYLKMCVLQSEDGGFFYHNGFLPESIREALVTDIKERRFVRGGSTISMQLVKNVFLSRHKTLARKFEEMLIVWLVETNRLSSKERMFEVYLNIIEWGPGIYGIREASRFYFDKEPADLNINESIYLASIIPSPKRALRSFTPDFKLKPELGGYYRLLAERLRVKEVISTEQELAVRADVSLSPAAKNAIEAFYSARADSLSYEVPEEIFEED